MGFEGYVLVVDDSVTNQVLIEALLGEEGIKTVAVSSTNDAIKQISKEPPRIIILDILMPNVTGIDLLKAIRQDEKSQAIPVIVVSAANAELYRNQCQMLGVNDFFPKPINIPALINRVKAILNGE